MNSRTLLHCAAVIFISFWTVSPVFSYNFSIIRFLTLPKATKIKTKNMKIILDK